MIEKLKDGREAHNTTTNHGEDVAVNVQLKDCFIGLWLNKADWIRNCA